jgi:glycosyltransferase involved in cell wall biosynthesis
MQTTVFLDNRFDRKLLDGIVDGSNVQIRSVAATISSRLWSEWVISRLANRISGSTLLCLGSIPPLFSCKANVIVYFQSVLYFKSFRRYISGFRSMVKLSIEALWIKARIAKANGIFVQSDLVKGLICKEFSLDENLVSVVPFVDFDSLKAICSLVDNKIMEGFFYPALGSPHKNHLLLIDAWILLAQQGIFPALRLTIDSRFESLLSYIDNAKEIHKIRVTNLGLISHQEVLNQLVLSEAMIFPSLCESFGLPLLEARENFVPVIAGEKDYVREILNPAQSFDPESALSIARAVKRFMKIEDPTLKIVSSDILLEQISRLL